MRYAMVKKSLMHLHNALYQASLHLYNFGSMKCISCIVESIRVLELNKNGKLSTDWCLTTFSTLFQLYRSGQCTFTCCTGVLCTIFFLSHWLLYQITTKQWTAATLIGCTILTPFFSYIAGASAPINLYSEFFLPILHTIFFPSHWLLSHVEIR